MSVVRAAFYTLGCKTNHYETDALRQQFAQAGFADASFDSIAEVYLINTCTVTGEAGRKSRQMLRRARKRNPEAIVVALGCHSELVKELDGVDIVIGTSGKSQALGLVIDALHRRGISLPEPKLIGTSIPDGFEEFGPVSRQSETRAYVKIEDGCNNFCSYCTIPLARGRVRSRDEQAVLAEVEALARSGYREVVLTGIHICSYGAERGLPSRAVMDLAKRIAETEGIERIRLGSLEPQSVTGEFIEQAVKNPKLLPHFHLSLQSGSDTVLQRMRRRYSTALYRDVVKKLWEAYDEPGLTTDVIVGFPGETEAEHEESLQFCREIGFSRLHVFRYSRRDGTPAANFPGQVDHQTASSRSQDMIGLADELALAFHTRQIGRQQVVLLEKKRADGLFEGYSPEYVPVRLPDRPGLQTGEITIVSGVQATNEILFCQ